ncbi:MAG: hypothetical protein IJT94_02380 [Oscillibacter sp.]|nr:hypothetical protein [Oscillibacter sp.]
MEKSALLDRLRLDGDDRLTMARVLDRAAQAQNRNIPAATDFLSPREQAAASDLLRLAEFPESSALFTGGYEGAERRLILFLPDWLDPGNAQPPVRCFRAAFRPEDGLTHRDLLGSLMGLGVVREKVGDILVSGDSADLLVLDSVADFLVQNWETAGRAKLTVSPVDLSHVHIPAAHCQDVRDTVSSLRLDAVASTGFRLSRGRAAELIAAGRVQVNWRDCEKPDRLVKQGDVVTARGFGKMELAEVGGVTRKGRISILVRRYL